MEFRAIVDLLGYAAGQELPVRITTRDDEELLGVPVSVDPDVGALEAYVRPVGETEEVAIALTRIRRVSLV